MPIETSSFLYSPDNPPPLEELKTRVFAVHSTKLLPKNGVMKAGIGDGELRKDWNGEPAFRATIHFALGEVVRSHMLGSGWDQNPYAIVTPLHTLEDQLINLFTHDTYILGDFRLTPDSIVVAPAGADTRTLPEDVPVERYNPRIGLRKAVDSVVASRDGWRIQMRDSGVSIGSVAFIEGTEINNPKFFTALFEEHPYLSYGSHVNSEMGEAYKFGVTDQIVFRLMTTYGYFAYMYDEQFIRLYKTIIEYNLEKLSEIVPTWGLNKNAERTFRAKKKDVEEWLNIPRVDLEIRKDWGKTFSRAPKGVLKRVRKARKDPQVLRAIAEEFKASLPNQNEFSSAPIQPTLGSTLHPYKREELDKIIDRSGIYVYPKFWSEFYARYATQRWIVLGNEKAKEEGLDQVITDYVPRLTKSHEVINLSKDTPILGDLLDYLSTESNKLDHALSILRLDEVKTFLNQEYGFNFTEDGPETLHDLYRAHPKVNNLFLRSRMRLTEDERLAYQLLKTLKLVRSFHKRSKKESLKSLRTADSYAFERRYYLRRLREDIETALRPIVASPDLKSLLAGDTLDLYQRIDRDEDLQALWEKVGLGNEFLKLFHKKSTFFQSERSLLEVYKLLQSIKASEAF